MKNNHFLILIVIAALGLGITYLLLLEPKPPPAWITVETISSSSETFIEVEEQDLMKYPKLATAIHQTVWESPSGISEIPGLMIKMTHDEGVALVTFLGGEYKKIVKTYFFKIRVNGDLYGIYIEFSEKRPSNL